MNIVALFSQHKTRNLFFATVSFTYAFIIYTMTVAPTASFWDPAEYIAISHTLQIAHPPGSPFFALVGRVVSMFVPTDYVALSINMISVTASSFTIMLLYLIVVRLVEEWRGPAEKMDTPDLLGLYGGGLIAAFTFTVTHTHWFNAVEAEMYASSMFFTALVVWIALKWSSVHDQPHADRWLILIAYLFGLGIGVHLLNLLALFFVALLAYFKKYTFSLKSFLGLIAVSITGFLSIYPVTIILIPDFAGRISGLTYGLIGPVKLIILFVSAIIAAVYWTHKKGYRTANLILLCYSMIIIGYSSYALVIIRSQAEPPIDENDPSTVEAFVSYLSRDQYGTSPLFRGHSFNDRTGSIDRSTEVFFPRRHSSQPHHLEYYSNFQSDLQFFLQYQVNHMYMRYLFWNFIGREADIQDTGWYSGFSTTRHANNPANSGYFYLPLLFGLFGMLYHFRKDWKRALSIFALFFLTGLAIIIYLNQTPYEPRERDYAYVGSFFAFTIFLGLGVTGTIELLKRALGNRLILKSSALGVIFLAVPAWMLIQNWPSHDRSEQFVARDYAYNLLNSVDLNAIIFTNGDNDTFPLWYLQEVERVRTDVRVVNLSLLNTDWYIKQMRDRQTHESLPLAISLTDEEIEIMTSRLELYEPREMVVPVRKDLLSSIFDLPAEVRTSLSISDAQELVPDDIEVTEMLLNQIRMATPFSLPVEELDDEVRWFLPGRSAGMDSQGNERFFLQTQDRMVLELIQNNMWLRPIYFANTVARSGQIGLEDYFQFEGKAFRIVPKKRASGPFGYVDPEVHASRMASFRFQGWNSPTVYFDENIRRMLGNYRYGFTQLADALIEAGDIESAAYWLRFGEEVIPFREIEHDWTVATLYAFRYMRVGEELRANNLAFFIAERLMHELTFDMIKLDETEARLARLDQDIQRARSRARTERARNLRTRQERVLRNRESIIQDISFSVSRLTILQNIFFEHDDMETAEYLKIEVDRITEARLTLPSTIEESRDQIRFFGLSN